MTITLVDLQTDFVVINKPADIGFHDEDGSIGVHNTLKNQLGLEALYPVHRLDKMTSGLLIFALNKSAAQQFQQLFEQKNVEKFYLAVSDSKPKKKQGLIKGDMEKSRRGMWKLTRTQNNPAITQFFSYSLGQGKRLFLAKPHTGKTHQIRVALASVGSPILGDAYYAKSMADRGYLHAYGLKFSLGTKNFSYLLTPDEGDDFTSSQCKNVLNEIGEPWQLHWPTC